MKTAVFGAGCFWHVQEEFDKLPVKTEVGYMGGDEQKYPKPSYEQVCSDRSGYVEVIKIEYDESKISCDKLLNLFWELHDPTSFNKQGADAGSQYKSVIFYYDEEQKKIAEKSLNREQKKYQKNKGQPHPKGCGL